MLRRVEVPLLVPRGLACSILDEIFQALRKHDRNTALILKARVTPSFPGIFFCCLLLTLSHFVGMIR